MAAFWTSLIQSKELYVLELAMLLLASFPCAVAYCTVCDRKLLKSLGMGLVITTTHLYDWVQWLITI